MNKSKFQTVYGVKIYPIDYLCNNELTESDLNNLLDNNKILIKVLNGKNGFDDKEYIRIAIKSSEENNYLIDCIKEYYDKM